MRKLSRKSKSSDTDSKSDVAVLSLPGLTSSNKAVNDLGKDVKSVPLNSSLLLLSQTRKLLFPEGEWYFNYLDCVSVVLGLLPFCLSVASYALSCKYSCKVF